MCRTLISVDWQGYVYDCDFNQMLELPLRASEAQAAHAARRPRRHGPRRAADRRGATTASAAPRGRGRAAEARSRRRPMAPDAPGRNCPLSYRYSPDVFRAGTGDRGRDAVRDRRAVRQPVRARRDRRARRAGVTRADARLQRRLQLVRRRSGAASPRSTRACSSMRRCAATSRPSSPATTAEAGCGCAYPEYVGDADVARSNAILARSARDRERGSRGCASAWGACRCTPWRPSAACAIGIVHGDAWSLAGWRFAQERLDDGRRIERAFDAADVSVFASSHTCLPVTYRVPAGVIANNGAAGMPNFRGTRFGLVTRIATDRARRRALRRAARPGRRRNARGPLRSRALARAVRPPVAGGLAGGGVLPQADRRRPGLRSRPGGAPRRKEPRCTATERCNRMEGSSMSKGRLAVLVVIAALVAAFFAFDLKQLLQRSSTSRRSRRRSTPTYEAHPLQTAAIFFAIYVAVTGLSLPGAAIMTLVGGRDLRPALGHGDRVVRLRDRRDARVPRLALPAARLGAGEVRRQARSRSTTASRRRARSTSSRCAWCRRSRSSSSTCVMGLTPHADARPSTG